MLSLQEVPFGPDRIFRGIDLVVEVVNPEPIEVAQDDVLRTIGDQTHPRISWLPGVPGQVRSALLLSIRTMGFQT